MKRGKVLMTVLVVLAVLFASCSNGMSKDDASGAASAEKVMVNLGVVYEGEAPVQKVVSVDDPLSNLTFYYKATPQWTQSRAIAGDTKNLFVQIPGYESGNAQNLGYFTAGMWQFDVEVRKGSNVIYEGTSDIIPIDNGHKTIAITVAPKTSGGTKGTVTITVEVPTTGLTVDPQNPQSLSSLETMSISYTGPDAVDPVNVPVTGHDLSTQTYISTFTTANLSLKPGAYTFTFLYTDASGYQNGGASLAVNVFANEYSNISGMIENGIWHSGTMTITTPGFSPYTLASDPENTYAIHPYNYLDYKCLAVATSGRATTYEWYVNGNPADNEAISTYIEGGKTGSKFRFNKDQVILPVGIYEITCVAKDGDYVAKSETLYLALAYSIKKAEMTGGAVGSNTYALGGETVTLTPVPENGKKLSGKPIVTKDSGGDPLSVWAVTIGDPLAPVETGSYQFTMPNEGVTVSATFVDAP